MHPLLTTSALALLASVTLAQRPMLKTATAVGDFAKDAKGTTYQFLKKGTVAGPRGLMVMAARRGVGSASTKANLISSHGQLVVQFGERGHLASTSTSFIGALGTSASADPRKIAPGAHAFLVQLPAKKGAKAKMLVSFAARAGKGAQAAVSVDFGADRKIEFQGKTNSAPVRKSFDVVAGATGFVFLVSSSGAATLKGKGMTGYGLELSVAFQPAQTGGKCSATAYGRSCSVLRGAFRSDPRFHNLHLSLTGGRPSSIGVAIIGTKKLNARFGRTSCYLLTDILAIGGVFRTDARGSAQHLLRIPAGRNLSFLTQDLTLGISHRQLEVKSSNGLAVNCKK